MSNIYSNNQCEEKKRSVSASAVVRIVIWSVVLCMLTGVLLLALLGESDWNFGVIKLGGFAYDDEGFSVGNGKTTETVRNIDIDWVSGKVTLVATDGDRVVISEDYNGDEDEHRLRWKIEGGELSVKYRGPSWFGADGLSKDLTVEIPQTMLDGLDEIHVDAVSAEQVISLPAKELEIDSVSGTVTVNGDYDLVEIDTVSGNVRFNGTVRDFDISGVSARLELYLAEQANSLDVDTVSGDVEVVLPENATGFRINTDTLSGDVDVRGFDGGSNRRWGDGSMEINMDGVSAKLIVEKETTD